MCLSNVDSYCKHRVSISFDNKARISVISYCLGIGPLKSLVFVLVVLTQVACKMSILLTKFWTTEPYLGPCQVSMMEILKKIVDGQNQINYFRKKFYNRFLKGS